MLALIVGLDVVKNIKTEGFCVLWGEHDAQHVCSWEVGGFIC